METLHAALLLHESKQEINEANMEKVLTAAGAKLDPATIKATVVALKDVQIDDVIKGVVAAPVAAPTEEAKPVEAQPEGAPAEEKKEESPEEEEKKEEEAAAGLSALFG